MKKFKFLDKLGRYVRKDYNVKLEILVDDLVVHDVEVPVNEYNKDRAGRKALRHVEQVSTVRVSSINKM